jgi:hypothetical protein
MVFYLKPSGAAWQASPLLLEPDLQSKLLSIHSVLPAEVQQTKLVLQPTLHLPFPPHHGCALDLLIPRDLDGAVAFLTALILPLLLKCCLTGLPSIYLQFLTAMIPIQLETRVLRNGFGSLPPAV